MIWTADGRCLLGWQKEGKSLFQLTHRAYVVGDSEASTLRRIKLEKADSKLIETWCDGKNRFGIQLSHELTANKPYFLTKIAVINLDAVAKVVDYIYEPIPTAAYGELKRGVAIFQIFKRWHEQPLDADLASHPFKASWGTREFCFDYRDYGWGSQLCLPIQCLYGARRDGVVLFCDPRIAFTFQRDEEGGRMLRRFYLPAKVGFREDGIDIQTGEGKIGYTVGTGLLTDPHWAHWAKLYNDFYLNAFPFAQWRRPASSVRLPVGGIGGYVPEGQRFDGVWAKRLKEANFAIIHGGSKHFASGEPDPDYYTKVSATAKQHQLLTYLWDNIMVMPDTQRYDGWVKKKESEHWENIASCDWRNFTDSLVKDPAGNSPLDCWEGKAGNNSPRFSFGGFELERIKQLIEKHNFDGMFLDFYDQATGSDFGHSYAHYPFYPLQVADMEYANALASWLHGRGKFFIVNGPDVSFSVIRFADAVTHDMGERVKFGVWYKCFTGYRPAIALLSPFKPDYGAGDIEEMFEVGIFNGFCVPWWFATKDMSRLSSAEWERLTSLSRQAMAVGWEIGRRRIIAGEPFRQYYFHHPDGAYFVTLRNEGKQQQVVKVALNLPWLHLSSRAKYDVWEWMLSAGWKSLGHNIIGAKLRKGGITVTIEPGHTKVLKVAPAGSGPLGSKVSERVG